MNEQPNGLGTVIEDEDRIHVMPLGDLREHETSCNCWCRPSAEDDDLIVHNSMDGREGIETGSTHLH